MKKGTDWPLGLLRISLGLLFFLLGIVTVISPEGFVGFIASLGIPAFFAWLALLSELVFGFAILIGWKTKYTIWPPFIVVLVATIMVQLPGAFDIPSISVFFQHTTLLAALLLIWKYGPGAWAVGKN